MGAVYGDAEVIRHRAGDLREQATELRLLADRLVGNAESVTWHGRAADAMRERIRDRASRLRELAVGHESAAEALDRHRDEVERLVELIAAAERRAGLRPAPGASPPPAGHQDWLDYDPGSAPDLPGEKR